MSMTTLTSYVTEAEASLYYANKGTRNEAWEAASGTRRNQCLIQASHQIDQLDFEGTKAEGQVHEFPRMDIDTGDEIETPQAVYQAVCEQALAIIDGHNVNEEDDDRLTTSAKIGEESKTFNRSISLAHVSAGLCGTAFRLILPYLRDPNSIRMIRA